MVIKTEVKKRIPQAAVEKSTAHLPVYQILIKKRESILLKEISFIEKCMADYKAERKASWKVFKSKMEADLSIIKQSIHELTHPPME